MSKSNREEYKMEVWKTPYDPKYGIRMKYGTGFKSKAEQLGEFEEFYEIKLPKDFLRHIEDWCECGFDGEWQVWAGKSLSVCWYHLMYMRVATKADYGSHHPKNALKTFPSLFYNKQKKMVFFPFGEAHRVTNKPVYALDEKSFYEKGFLVFAVREKYAIKYVSSKVVIDIAPTFTKMMKKSQFCFFG